MQAVLVICGKRSRRTVPGSQMGAVLYRRGAGERGIGAEWSRLVELHVGLAERIARRRCRWGLEDPDDTRSDAFWGLTLAGRAFEPDRGSFATYATLRIEYAIRRGRQVRSGLSRSVWEQGGAPWPLSLNVPAGENGSEVLDALPSADPDWNGWLREAVRRLPARERLVVGLRYDRDLTQSEVAAAIGRSQMQVSRIERAALAKLREWVAE
jgi:DNA-directed RNA polymerase specialized sigma subunit